MTPITIQKLTITIFILLLLNMNSHTFSKRHPKNDMIPKISKITRLQFYFHDTISGLNPTAIPILPPAINSSTTGFGSMVMIDDPLTEGPKLKSKLLGRAQGLYASADLSKYGFMMVMNYVFTEKSRYNGSTLSLMGRNEILSDVREMSIVGGTGFFRFAKGYALAKSVQINITSGNAIVEYNVTVMHY